MVHAARELQVEVCEVGACGEAARLRAAQVVLLAADVVEVREAPLKGLLQRRGVAGVAGRGRAWQGVTGMFLRDFKTLLLCLVSQRSVSWC